MYCYSSHVGEDGRVIGQTRNIFWSVKPRKEETLWRPRHRWEDNIKVYLIYLEYEGVGSIYVA
jgi:hypothetical protein